MKQVLFLVMIVIFTTPLLTAQEISASQIQTQIINQRYSIAFNAPRDDSNSDATYDIVFFARVPGTAEWFRLHALVGEYRDIREGNSGKVFWEPILDYHKMIRYDFKLIALNTLYLDEEYDYVNTEQVGFLNAYSDLSDTGFWVNGERAGFRLPLALPVGDYSVSMYSGQKMLNSEQFTISHLALTEVDLTPGTMTLSALQADVKYQIEGKIYNQVRDMMFPSGVYEVEAFLDNPTGGKLFQKVSLTVSSHKPTPYTFDLQYGYLNLSSNRYEAVYYIDGVKNTQISKIPMNPGTHVLTATLVTSNSWLNNYSVSKEITIEPGETKDVVMEFAVGKLTLTGSETDLLFVLRPQNVQVGDAALRSYNPNQLLPIQNFTRNWVYQGHSYYCSDTPMTWSEARNICWTLGGHLVTVSSEAENNIVYENTTGLTWLGLTDVAIEGSYTWVNDEPLHYTNWAQGEPNNQGDEDVAQIRFRDYGPKWNDSAGKVSEKAYAVLEYDFLNFSRLPGGVDPKDAMKTVQDLELPAGEYLAYAVLLSPNKHELDLVKEKYLKLEADKPVSYHFKYDFAYLTFKSNTVLSKLTVDSHPVETGKELRLLPGPHNYSAYAAEPYYPLQDVFINLEAGEHKQETLRLKTDKELLARMKRREFALQYGNGLLLKTFEINHYYGVATTAVSSADLDNLIKATGTGLTISGFQVRAGSTMIEESDKPYSMTFPRLYIGFGLLDKITFVKTDNANNWGVMYDLLTANTGVALLSHGGNVYSTLDITGIYGLQKPFQAKSGPYVYATLQDPGRFEQRDYDKNDFQFGAEAKYQIGLRISKGNYLHLHLGIRLMSDYEGDWYLKSELDEWKEHPNSLKPQTTHKAGLRSDNVAFEGPSFYFGIGWDNGFTSPTE